MKIRAFICRSSEVCVYCAKLVRILLICFFSFVPAVVQAQFTYTTNADNTLTITGYTGDGDALSIPTNINGLVVSGIGLWAFIENTNVRTVTIPGSVTSVGYGAFNGCSLLTSVTMPDSLTYISDLMFSGCPSLTNASIPPSVTSIGDEAFYSTGLTTVTIPTNVTSIGEASFSECNALTNAWVSGKTIFGSSPYLVLRSGVNRRMIRK